MRYRLVLFSTAILMASIAIRIGGFDGDRKLNNQDELSSPSSLLIVAGTTPDSQEELKSAIDAATRFDELRDIRILRRECLDRVVCLFDGMTMLALEEGIVKSIVDGIPTDQSVYHYSDPKRPLAMEDIELALNAVPWDIDVYREQFRFHRDFSDRMKLTEHATVLISDPVNLGWLRDFKGTGDGVKFAISVSLITVDTANKCSLLVMFYDPEQLSRDKELREDLVAAGATLTNRSAFFIDADGGRSSSAAEFLREWVDAKLRGEK